MGDYSILGRNSSSRNVKQKSPWIGNTCLSPKNNLLESQLELVSDKKIDTISRSQVPRLKHSESFKSTSALARDQSENVLKSDREALSEFIQIEKRLAESRFSSANLSKNSKAPARLSHKSDSQKKLGSQSSRQLVTTPPIPSPNMSTGFAQFHTQDMQTYQLSNKIPFKWEKRIKKGVWNADGACDSLQQRATVSEACATDQVDDDSPHHNPFSYSGPKHQQASSKPHAPLTQGQPSTPQEGSQTQKKRPTPAKTKPAAGSTPNPNSTPTVPTSPPGNDPTRHLPRTNTACFGTDRPFSTHPPTPSNNTQLPSLPSPSDNNGHLRDPSVEQHVHPNDDPTTPDSSRSDEHRRRTAEPQSLTVAQPNDTADGDECWNPSHTFGRPVGRVDADDDNDGKCADNDDERDDGSDEDAEHRDGEFVEGSVQEMSAYVSESRLEEGSRIGEWPSALDSVPRTLFHQTDDEQAFQHEKDRRTGSNSDSKQVQMRLAELLEEQSTRVELLNNIRLRMQQTSWWEQSSHKKKDVWRCCEGSTAACLSYQSHSEEMKI